MLFDWLVTGQVIRTNPAHSVRGPKHAVKRGKTPVLVTEQARNLLESINTSSVVGLRDRALIGVMTYTFARVGAVVAMTVDDYYPEGKRWWLRLHEKGGKRHEMPAHHSSRLISMSISTRLGSVSRGAPNDLEQLASGVVSDNGF
jgi:site-specific recombinase XerC